MPRPIDTLELFYAHALAIEREAMDRYEEFRESFRERGEEVLASLCDQIAREEREHCAKLVRASSHMTLPAIDARKYQWFEDASPEAPPHEAVCRVGTALQLLEIALAGEIAARRFFRWVVRTSRDPGVRAAARALSRDEAEHVRRVMDALQYREPTLDWERRVAMGEAFGAATLD